MEEEVISFTRLVITSLLLAYVAYYIYKFIKYIIKNIDHFFILIKLPKRSLVDLIITWNTKDIFEILTGGRELGPIYSLLPFVPPAIMIQGADGIKAILSSKTHINKSEFLRQQVFPLVGDGLATSTDNKWRNDRKLFNFEFNIKIMDDVLKSFNKNTGIFLNELKIEANTNKSFDIFHYSNLYHLKNSIGSFIGVELDKQETIDLNDNLQKLGEILNKKKSSIWLQNDYLFSFLPQKKQMNELLDYLDKYSLELSNKRIRALTQADYATETETLPKAVMDTYLKQGPDCVSSKDIRDQIITFIIAGFETTSAAFAWTLFLIGTYPEAQEKILEELDEVFGYSDRLPDINDLNNLKYLERCIKESMRIYPSVPVIERQVQEDVLIGGFLIPSGCHALINIYNVHRDPMHWSQPELFDPDRFLPENITNRHPYAYVPFSAGPRNCIGHKFAMMSLKVTLSTILRQFRVEAAQSRDSILFELLFTLTPKNGLLIKLSDRKKEK